MILKPFFFLFLIFNFLVNQQDLNIWNLLNGGCGSQACQNTFVDMDDSTILNTRLELKRVF